MNNDPCILIQIKKFVWWGSEHLPSHILQYINTLPPMDLQWKLTQIHKSASSTIPLFVCLSVYPTIFPSVWKKCDNRHRRTKLDHDRWYLACTEQLVEVRSKNVPPFNSVDTKNLKNCVASSFTVVTLKMQAASFFWTVCTYEPNHAIAHARSK
jgi:hypothetical protein